MARKRQPAHRLPPRPKPTAGLVRTSKQPHTLLRLQQQLGNRTVVRLLQRESASPGRLPTIPTNPPSLMFGSAGALVKLLQRALNAAGRTLDVDGQFGPLTRRGVQRFQRERGLDVDGIVGPKTWGALRNARPGNPPVGTTTADDRPHNLVDRPSGAPPDKAAILLLRSLMEGGVTDPELIARILAGALGVPSNQFRTIPIPPAGDHLTTLIATLHALKAKVARLIEQGTLSPAALSRANLLLDFLSKQAASIAVTPEDALDPARAATVAAAMSQVGRVKERQPAGDEFDEKKQRRRPVRLGWQHLDDYFTTAYGGRTDSDGSGYGPQLQDQVRFADRELQQDWCGIFALWALKTAGVPMSNWRVGQGPSTWQPQPASYRPQPGDVAYWHEFQTLSRHVAIIVRIDDDQIHTIDGNIGVPGEIAPRTRSISQSGVQYLKPDSFS